MAQCTIFPAGNMGHTLKRQKDLRLNGLRNTIRTNCSLENDHGLFQNTVMRPGTIRARTKLSLLIETRIGTHGRLRRV